MRCEVPLPLLGLLLCLLIILVSFLIGPNSNEDFVVEISGTTVTITCPLSGDNIKWEPTGKKIINNKYVVEDHDSSPLSLTCMENEDNKNKRALYLNARVCPNCEELDTLAVIGIIIADLLITLGILILVHYCSKNKRGQTSAGAGRRPQAQKMQRPPPVPNPDYEPIRKGQREVYAGLEHRGF
ncbi:CD3E protein, partial [Odontophorus gujanensis]|nr:CD3E protein [Odontophorus gujanensis]